MITDFAGGVTPAQNAFADVDTVVESPLISPTAQVIVALEIRLTLALDPGDTLPADALVVFGAVSVGLADLNTFAILAALVLVAISMRTARDPTEVVDITKFRRWTVVVGITRQAFTTAGNWIPEVALSALAGIGMNLRNADRVIAASGRRLANINAFVLKANVAFLLAV